MNRSLQHSTWCFRLLSKSKRLKTYFDIGVVLLTGCTATQVRWDASKMRKDVMVYYNDEIMDNLIRAKYHLPFVHVDLQSLTSQGASQISGTIGAGETRTHNNSPVGVLANIVNTVTRPFAYSVTPQQSETLTITAAPALGGQTIAEAPPMPLAKLEVTRTSETKKKGQPTEVTTEKTLKPPAKPPTVTIYDLYEGFAASYLSGPDIRPPERPYVPGTLKRWGMGTTTISMTVIDGIITISAGSCSPKAKRPRLKDRLRRHVQT